VTEGGGGDALVLAVLPAETGRAARCTVATKGKKTCEKFRQMKTHSEGYFFVCFFWGVRLPPSRLIVGHVGCAVAEGEKKGVNEVVKESQ